MRVIITRITYKTALFRKKTQQQPYSKIQTDHDCRKAARASAPKTRKTIMSAKNTANTIMLAKKTNITLFSDKAIKKPKLFLPDAVERPQGLSRSKSALWESSRSYQAPLLPTSAPLPNALKYGSPLVRSQTFAALRATAAHKKPFAATAALQLCSLLGSPWRLHPEVNREPLFLSKNIFHNPHP